MSYGASTPTSYEVSTLGAGNGQLPKSPANLFMDHFGALQSYAQTSSAVPEPRATSRTIHRRIHLSAEDTTGLINAVRAGATSVHGIVAAAILAAQFGHGRSAGTPVSMKCWSLVDLRGRVDPPVGATNTTNFFGAYPAVVTISDNADLLDMGRSIRNQVTEVVGSRTLPLIDLSPLKTALEERLATTFVSNVGVIAPLASPASLTHVDFRLNGSRAAVIPGHRVYSFNGRLTIHSSYMGTYCRSCG